MQEIDLSLLKLRLIFQPARAQPGCQTIRATDSRNEFEQVAQSRIHQSRQSPSKTKGRLRNTQHSWTLVERAKREFYNLPPRKDIRSANGFFLWAGFHMCH